MSILLDALKKSESQRQLGKTPGIHTPIEAHGKGGDAEHQWIALSMLLLSAAAIGWFSWQQFREPATALDVAGRDIVATPQVQGKPMEQEKPADANPTSSKKAKPVASARNKPKSMWSEKRDLSGLTVLPPGTPEFDTLKKEQLSRSFSSYEADETTAEAETKAVSNNETTAPSPPASIDLSNQIASQSSSGMPPATEEAEERTSPGSSRRLQTHETEPISFWQIPQALRDDLPEFKINVLVYAEKPEDRFLLINGQRLVEKEELMNGVVLDEIRRDGAVFRYRNYRFLVKG